MTRKTLGLTRKPIKDAQPVADEAEAMVGVGVESEADPQKRFLNGVAINPTPGIRLESGSEKLTVRMAARLPFWQPFWLIPVAVWTRLYLRNLRARGTWSWFYQETLRINESSPRWTFRKAAHAVKSCCWARKSWLSCLRSTPQMLSFWTAFPERPFNYVGGSDPRAFSNAKRHGV